MAFGKFLSGLLGKPASNPGADSDAKSQRSSFTAEDVFGDLVENLEKQSAKVEPAHISDRRPMAALPSYVPKVDEESALQKKWLTTVPAQNLLHEMELDPPTEVDGIILIGEATPTAPNGSGSSGVREIESRSPTSEPWPDTPLEDVMPKILSLESLGGGQEDVDTEHDSDIFYPTGHPGLGAVSRSSDPPVSSPQSSAAKVSAMSAMPPVSPDKKAANMGSAQKVGWGLRLAAKLAAANRTPTPLPESGRIRVPRRAMSDSELIPPLYFKKHRPGGL
jgi:hypothetical protein